MSYTSMMSDFYEGRLKRATYRTRLQSAELEFELQSDLAEEQRQDMAFEAQMRPVRQLTEQIRTISSLYSDKTLGGMDDTTRGVIEAARGKIVNDLLGELRKLGGDAPAAPNTDSSNGQPD